MHDRKELNMNVNDFANLLTLDLAVEQCGENPDLPDSWQADSDHYLVALLRPGAREAMLHFSVPGGADIPDAYWVLGALSVQSAMYVAHPTCVTWCELTGLPLVDVAPHWPAFERDQQSLQTFFGDHYPMFLELE